MTRGELPATGYGLRATGYGRGLLGAPPPG